MSDDNQRCPTCDRPVAKPADWKRHETDQHWRTLEETRSQLAAVTAERNALTKVVNGRSDELAEAAKERYSAFLERDAARKALEKTPDDLIEAMKLSTDGWKARAENAESTLQAIAKHACCRPTAKPVKPGIVEMVDCGKCASCLARTALRSITPARDSAECTDRGHDDSL